MSSGRFTNSTAVVIGGNSGLGLGAAERIHAEGGRVIVGARRAEQAAEVGEKLGGWGGQCDITDDASLEAFVASIREREESVQVGINCAGFAESIPLSDLPSERLRAMVDVQLVGAIRAMGLLCDLIAEGGGGSFLSISSLTAHRPAAGQIAYGASKAGLEYATEIAALEYGPKQVRVNTVAPSLVETPMTGDLFDMRLIVETMRSQTPLGRMGTVDDIVGPMVFMVSDEARFVTGQTLIVDGGTTTQKLPADGDYAAMAQLKPELLEGLS